MYINDKYNVDVIMSIVSSSDAIFDTPHDYCVDYNYEETHSITLEDLRDILTDLFKKKRGD